jgi:hypothetical protein
VWASRKLREEERFQGRGEYVYYSFVVSNHNYNAF